MENKNHEIIHIMILGEDHRRITLCGIKMNRDNKHRWNVLYCLFPSKATCEKCLQVSTSIINKRNT